jgi:glutamyl-tRNA reductase
MSILKQLYVLGQNIHTAGVDDRGQLCLAPGDAEALMRATRDRLPGVELAVLSTCNRVEFYLACADREELGRWRGLLGEFVEGAAEALAGGLHLCGERAFMHLCRVAAGLDSAVLGDAHILKQVRRAVGLAGERGCLGAVLQEAFTEATRLGGEARAQTAISRGAVGLGSALAELLAERLRGIPAPRILVVGAGEIGADVASRVAKRRVGELLITNRSRPRAATLAARCGGGYLPWEGWEHALQAVDVVVLCTAARAPLAPRGLLERAAARGRLRLLADLGVPRQAEDAPGLEVMDVDQIARRSRENLDERSAAVPLIEEMIAARVRAWRQRRAAEPFELTVGRLYQIADIQAGNLARVLETTPQLSAEQVERMVRGAFKNAMRQHIDLLRNLYQMPRPGDDIIVCDSER